MNLEELLGRKTERRKDNKGKDRNTKREKYEMTKGRKRKRRNDKKTKW